MGILEELTERMKQAMKDKNTPVLEALRAAKSAFKYREVELTRELTDDDRLDCIRKEIKKRSEAEKEYRAAGRTEQADREAAERAELERFMPEPFSDEELDAVLNEAIQKIGAADPKKMGLVMKEVMPKMRGRADGGRVSKALNRLLGAGQ